MRVACHRGFTRSGLTLAFACSLLLSSSLPAAARGTPKPSGKNSKEVSDATAMLRSTEHDEIETGIQTLGLLGTPAAVQPIMDRVRAGLPPDLLETSIVTLMALGQPQAAPLYFELLDYRRPEIRLRAIEAIVALKPSGSEPALQKALADGDTKVRSAAALALGELRATGSVELLFQALDRGTFEAAQAIGQAVHSEQMPRVLSYLGSIPFRSLAAAFTEILQRKDISERDKLSIVSRLQEVGTREVKEYFGELTRTSADKLPPPVHRAMLRAMQEIAD
jgi:HEAT repeat protein